jgi:hypothetical protein
MLGRKDPGMQAYLSSCSCRLPDHRFTATFLSGLLMMVRVNARPGNAISRGCLPAHTSVGELTDEGTQATPQASAARPGRGPVRPGRAGLAYSPRASPGSYPRQLADLSPLEVPEGWEGQGRGA